ncbi:clarin-3 [Latimeria chalumnae]|uniref:clarin-3 n=1 Tax=Latimeria chalumnae TaxID=7897 RepID=UPI0003C116E6|nr:PREDICTED: clarin-3 [Latimeria chalumnae]|eukprot:XP_005995874.1 PREDICTED: clarin-3 [Latimeria chalumnae]
MPSTKKTLMYLFGFIGSVGACLVICAVLATENWVSATIKCKNSNGTFEGIVNVNYGLFKGNGNRKSCPIFGGTFPISVTESLKGDSRNKILHILIVLFLALSLLSSLVDAGITLYNSVSNPYETLFGPVGVYIWSSISGILILLSIILFVVNTEEFELSIKVANGSITDTMELKESKDSYGYSFWLMLLVLALHIFIILIIYAYQHASYSHKKKQQRPTENAPKEIMLY